MCFPFHSHLPLSHHKVNFAFFSKLIIIIGNFTCAGYPGIVGYAHEDANLFANWGVDYVKLDGCYSLPLDMDIGYPDFGRHLNSTGRPMIYSCSWPVYQIYAGISVSIKYVFLFQI